MNFAIVYSVCNTADANVADWIGLPLKLSNDGDVDHPTGSKITSSGMHAASALEVSGSRPSAVWFE